MILLLFKGFPGGSVIKNPPANAGDTGSVPGLGRSQEEEMATHSRILAWRIPQTEEDPDLLLICHLEDSNGNSSHLAYSRPVLGFLCSPSEETLSLFLLKWPSGLRAPQ